MSESETAATGDASAEASPAAKPKREGFSLFGFVFALVLAVGATWLTVSYWLALYADWQAEVYLPGKYGGGSAPVVLAVMTVTPFTIVVDWLLIHMLRPLFPPARRFGRISFAVVLIASCALIIVGALLLAPADVTAMVSAVVAPVGVLTVLVLISQLNALRRGDEDAFA